MVKTIAHLADIHLRKTPTRNEEYVYVFEKLIKSLKEKKPDRIIIVGDIVHDYLALGTEQSILGRRFLKSLSEITEVIITRGNHDCLKSNLKRRDSIEAMISGLDLKNIKYLNETGFYEDDNVIWTVWHHGSKRVNPWKTKEGKDYIKNKPKDKTFIDLFHNPINSSITSSGYKMKNDGFFGVSDFKGDYSFLGDIHLKQYLDAEKTKAYSGSLIAQDFSEGDNHFHGYLFWNIETKEVEEIEIENIYHKYVNIYLNNDTDFDSLDFYLDSKIKNISLRIIWETLPATRNTTNEQKIKKHVTSQHKNVRIFHKNKFIEDESIDIKQSEEIKNIMEQEVQHEIFVEYLHKIGVSKKDIDEIIELDKEISNHINEKSLTGFEWDVVKFGGVNFMSYEKFDIDWRDKMGIYQITGKNTSGKTTLVFKFIPFMLFGKILETEKGRIKHGDIRFINNRNNADFTEGYLVLDINSDYFGVKKRVQIEKNKAGEISGVPTKTTYHKLSSPDDELTESNNVDFLDENIKNVVESKIKSVVGSYDNFMRVVLTTSDTLNSVLSSDMSDFMDSLLFDSGLDIFDKKLTAVKKHEKRINDKGRISCDVEAKKTENDELYKEIKTFDSEIEEIEKNDLLKNKNKINDVVEKIKKENEKIYNIDPDISSLNVDSAKKDVLNNEKYIKSNQETIDALKETNKILSDDYDSERLVFLERRREEHRDVEFKIKLQIKDFFQEIEKHKHSIEIIRGQIQTLKKEGGKLKEEASNLKKNKTCPKCGQELTDEHKKHINAEIDKLVEQMYAIKDEIERKETEDIISYENKIKDSKKKITIGEEKIEKLNNAMDDVLTEIGEITNQKNDVEKRQKNNEKIRELTVENENLELKSQLLKQKIKEYEKSLVKIEENKEIRKKIYILEDEQRNLEEEKTNYQNSIYLKKIEINNRENKINEIDKTIKQFKEQEKRDTIFKYYKRCVHREGIPKQIIINHIIPKINKIMSELLTETSINVWLDEITLKPRLVYDERPNAVIDCIGSSGQERTYSSVVLKFALNQINIKSKPKIFMLDEIMGKLDDNSVEEFVQIMHNIKRYMNRVLIVEHNHNVIPDYLIDVSLNENGLSEANLIDN